MGGCAPMPRRSPRVTGRGSGCAMDRRAFGSRPWRWAMAQPEAQRPIEAALERLEAIADRLGGPQLDLDRAGKTYEEGFRPSAGGPQPLGSARSPRTQVS